MSNQSPDVQNLQVLDSGSQQPTKVEVQPSSDAAGRTERLEDRILTPDETEALLRGKPLPEKSDLDNADDPEQAEMVQQFMKETEGMSPPGQTPTSPQPPREPQPITDQQRQQAVQQDLQQQSLEQQPQPPQQQPPQPSPTEAALQAQLQLLQQQNQAMQQQIQQMQQPQQSAPLNQPQAPQFSFDVPDAYMNALASEDAATRKAALNSMLNGVAEAVMERAQQAIRTFGETVPQIVQTQAQSLIQAKDVQRDMYGTYPELEPYREFVKTAAQQLAGSVGLGGWNADVRDAIAERVAPMVPGLFQKIQAQRAARVAPGQMPQPLPQGQWQQPVGSPNQMPSAVGGMHGAPASPQPVYVRDASGNLVPAQVQQRPFHGGNSRPEAEQIDPQLLDIWQTLGYSR